MKSRRLTHGSPTTTSPHTRRRSQLSEPPLAAPRAPCAAPRSPFPVPEVHLTYALPRRGIPSPTGFRAWVGAALAAAGHAPAAGLSIRIVGSHEGRGLNRRYRGVDHATNVLSFGMDLPSEVASAWLGDLVIAAPVVAREARAQGKIVRDHYAHLTVHGVLHLLGYDHQRPREAARMEALEVAALATLGVPDPYRDAPARLTPCFRNR